MKELIRRAMWDGACLVVEASVYDRLAVHRRHDIGGGVLSGWTVTHIPTGKAVRRGISFRDARRLAKELSTLDWNWGKFGRKPRMTKRVRATLDAAVAILER